jgi:tetratricopeptide (TPR) repeat protein
MGMSNTSLPSRPSRHLHSDELAWLNQAAEEARREWPNARRRGGPSEKAQALACLSGIVCDLEGPEAALHLSRRAHHLWKVVGDPSILAISGAVLAVRLLDAGRTKEALRQSAEALEAMRRLDPLNRHKGVPRCLGKDFLQAGYAAEAQAWLELALENPADGERAGILVNLSRALELQGNLPEARDRQNEACSAFHLQEERFAMAKAMLRLTRLDIRLGHEWEAASLFQEAARVLTMLDCLPEVAEGHELNRLLSIRQLLLLRKHWGCVPMHRSTGNH